MKTWQNGDDGGTVKRIIDENFDTLERRIDQNKTIYIKDFVASDWSSGIIYIEYSEYNKANPCVDMYIKTNDGYIPVLCEYKITSAGIELQSDLVCEGRVVIR